MDEEEFKQLVIEAFKPVNKALWEALHSLAKRDILARTYFNAEHGISVVMLEKPGHSVRG